MYGHVLGAALDLVVPDKRQGGRPSDRRQCFQHSGFPWNIGHVAGEITCPLYGNLLHEPLSEDTGGCEADI